MILCDTQKSFWGTNRFINAPNLDHWKEGKNIFLMMADTPRKASIPRRTNIPN